MSIRVFNHDALHQLQTQIINTSPRSPRQLEKPREGHLTKTRRPNSIVEGRMQLKHKKFVQEQEKIEKHVAALTADNIRKSQARKESYYLHLCSELENANKLAGELQDRIDLQEAMDDRRKQKLYNEWTEQVYNKLHDPINDKINDIGRVELNRRRREAYQRFLDKTNKKGALFRDIILESEYDPLHDNPPVQCPIRKINDPCGRVLQRYEEEEAIASGKRNRGQKTSTGRKDNLDVKLWSTGVFESTTHGYSNKLMNTTSKPISAQPAKIHFDHYKVPTGSEVLAAEIPLGKRTHFKFKTPASETHISLKQ